MYNILRVWWDQTKKNAELASTRSESGLGIPVFIKILTCSSTKSEPLPAAAEKYQNPCLQQHNIRNLARSSRIISDILPAAAAQYQNSFLQQYNIRTVACSGCTISELLPSTATQHQNSCLQQHNSLSIYHKIGGLHIERTLSAQ